MTFAGRHALLLLCTMARAAALLQPVPCAHSARVVAHRARPTLHGGHHHNHESDIGAGVQTIRVADLAPAALMNYATNNVVRPTILNILVLSSNLRRHVQTRSASKAAKLKAEPDAASRITWMGAVVNLALASFKLFAGIAGRSAAIIADAGHSFSDLISDALTLVALRISDAPADVDHPYGHGRFEAVGSLAIGTLLLGAGASFGTSALGALRRPATAPLGTIALWAALISILSKEMLFRATLRIGKRLSSPVLVANAWHHRSDALSSVVAVVGVGGALLGYPFLDPLAGLVVAGLVSWMGVRIGVEALAELTDTSDYAVVQQVERVARSVDGVDGVDQVRSRTMGGAALVDLAIRVDPMLSASTAHQLAEEVRLSVMQDVPAISEVLVHVDTSGHDATCPLQTRVLSSARTHTDVEDEVRQTLGGLDAVLDVPRVQVYYVDGGVAVEAHARMRDDLNMAEMRSAAAEGRRQLLAASPDLTDVFIGADLSEGSTAPPPAVYA